MPVIDEMPELALDASGPTETYHATFEGVGSTLAGAPATSGAQDQQAYVCPAHPNGE